MRTLERLNLKDPSTVGYLQRWYGYKWTSRILWTDKPENRPADYAVIVETLVHDPVYVRAVLAAQYGEVPRFGEVPAFTCDGCGRLANNEPDPELFGSYCLDCEVEP